MKTLPEEALRPPASSSSSKSSSSTSKLVKIKLLNGIAPPWSTQEDETLCRMLAERGDRSKQSVYDEFSRVSLPCWRDEISRERPDGLNLFLPFVLRVWYTQISGRSSAATSQRSYSRREYYEKLIKREFGSVVVVPTSKTKSKLIFFLDPFFLSLRVHSQTTFFSLKSHRRISQKPPRTHRWSLSFLHPLRRSQQTSRTTPRLLQPQS